jgi:hypothetical protein
MSIHVRTAAKASVGDAPKRALEVNPAQLGRSAHLGVLVLLIVVQVAWAGVLLYGGYRAIGAFGGLA